MSSASAARGGLLVIMLAGLLSGCGGGSANGGTGGTSGGSGSGGGGASSGGAGGGGGSAGGGGTAVGSGGAGVGSGGAAAGSGGGGGTGTGGGGAAAGTGGGGGSGGSAGSAGTTGGGGGGAAGAGGRGGGSGRGGAAGGSSGTGGRGGASSGGRGGATAGAGGGGSGGTASCSGPVGTISGALATGVAFMDTDGERVNAHGGGIIKVGDTFYMHGMYFLSTTTDNNFVGFSMYSSRDLATWKNEGLILPRQASGELGPNRKGERPHIIRCPSTGEFVLYAHAASEDYQTDKEIVYATSATVNGQYAYKGPLKNASGTIIARSDMSAYADETGAYVLTESAHVFTLASDCHSWVSDKSYSTVNGDSGGAESPTVFKAGSTYYWIGSYKTGWRANNNFYSTAPAITGPWTYQGYLAPVTDPADNISPERTWLSQSTWVQPVAGCNGTVYLYWGDHWDGTESTTAPGRHNYLATHVFQPLVFNGTKISLPTYKATWKIDVGAGTWSQ
ncbi:MAG TPA: family 43 glycosylhydrolase [Polyangia bacterium]